MAKRSARKTKTHKKPARKTAAKRKTKAKSASKKSIALNKKAHWEAYRELQKRVDKAWTKLKADVKKKARPQILIRDKNHLLLLLGECNYMARECMRMASKAKKRR